MTEGSGVGGGSTVAREAIGFLHAATLVPAEGPVAAAVARAARSDPGGDLGPLLQVQSDTVQLQGADAAQEALLSGRRASCQRNTSTARVIHWPSFSVFHIVIWMKPSGPYSLQLTQWFKSLPIIYLCIV